MEITPPSSNEVLTQPEHIPGFEQAIRPDAPYELLSRLFDTGNDKGMWTQVYDDLLSDIDSKTYTVGSVAKDFSDILSVRSTSEESVLCDITRISQLSNFLDVADVLIKAGQVRAAKSGEPYTLSRDDISGMVKAISTATERLPDVRSNPSLVVDLDLSAEFFINGPENPRYVNNIGNNKPILENMPGGQEIIASIENMQSAMRREADKAHVLEQAEDLISENQSGPVTAEATDQWLRSQSLKPKSDSDV